VHRLLVERGYREEARRLCNAIVQLINRSGFREYYDPTTGEGYGARNFTWAGLVVDMSNAQES